MNDSEWRDNRRQFCKTAAAASVLAAIGHKSVLADESKSLKTQGTLKPVFEEIACRWTPETPRHDHQLIFPLSDDGLMLVWSEYYSNRPSLIDRKPTTKAGEAADNVPCRISARISTDRCRTWSDRIVLQDNVWRYNVKHPNLLRLPSGEVLFFSPVGIRMISATSL